MEKCVSSGGSPESLTACPGDCCQPIRLTQFQFLWGLYFIWKDQAGTHRRIRDTRRHLDKGKIKEKVSEGYHCHEYRHMKSQRGKGLILRLGELCSERAAWGKWKIWEFLSLYQAQFTTVNQSSLSPNCLSAEHKAYKQHRTVCLSLLKYQC